MKENLNDLRAFVGSTNEQFYQSSSTDGRVAVGVVAQHSGIEERLQIKLFHRTTRSISTTEAGEAVSTAVTAV